MFYVRYPRTNLCSNKFEIKNFKHLNNQTKYLNNRVAGIFGGKSLSIKNRFNRVYLTPLISIVTTQKFTSKHNNKRP